MAKGRKRKPPKHRDAAAAALASPLFRQRITRNGKAYRRPTMPRHARAARLLEWVAAEFREMEE